MPYPTGKISIRSVLYAFGGVKRVTVERRVVNDGRAGITAVGRRALFVRGVLVSDELRIAEYTEVVALENKPGLAARHEITPVGGITSVCHYRILALDKILSYIELVVIRALTAIEPALPNNGVAVDVEIIMRVASDTAKRARRRTAVGGERENSAQYYIGIVTVVFRRPYPLGLSEKYGRFFGLCHDLSFAPPHGKQKPPYKCAQ